MWVEDALSWALDVRRVVDQVQRFCLRAPHTTAMNFMLNLGAHKAFTHANALFNLVPKLSVKGYDCRIR